MSAARPRPRGRTGFTLLEMLVALALLATAFAIVYGAFAATTRAWRRGAEVADGLRRGDFVMEQCVAALRSAAYFPDRGDAFGFRLEPSGGAVPADRLSWVTASPAFLPPGSPLARSVHRLELTVAGGPSGEPAVAVRAWPYLLDEREERESIETWFVEAGVEGLGCRVYDFEKEEWTDRWEDTNRVPARVEVSLHLAPAAPGDPRLVLRRAVEIPVAAATNAAGRTAAPAAGGPT